MIRYLALTTLALVLATGAPDARATSHHHGHLAAPMVQDRYCLQGRNYGYPGDCSFSTFEQCQATASGTDSGCGINPMAAYARQRPGYY
jgi:Protein of unknown function (DUF3551)